VASGEDTEALLETLVASTPSGQLNLRESIQPRISQPTQVLKALATLADGERASSIETQLELGELLGEGGMGLVHLATQRSLGRKVAVKSVRPDRRDDENLASLVREAWTAGALEHPNIAPIHDLGLGSDGDPLVVLKRIEGAPWSELMDNADAVSERFDSDDLLAWNLDILLQVTNAIRFAHSRGVVHRDLKPDNVMIGSFGEVYVVDWGIAVSTGKNQAIRLPLGTAITEPAGTPGFMAPEMLFGDTIDERTDVYLLGGMLYRLLTGRLPHEARRYSALVDSIRNSHPTFDDSVPTELQDICTRAMAARPASRYADADAFQGAVREFLGHRESERLTDVALERLSELATCLEDSGESGDVDIEALHQIFSECRFGFRVALESWQGNERAASALDRAVRIIVGVELGRDEPHAAKNVLGDLSAPDPKLSAEVDEAITSKERRLARLDAIQLQNDPKIGSRTRTFVSSILGVVFTLTPLFLARWGTRFTGSYETMALFSSGIFILVIFLVIWARESLMKTVTNRRVVNAALFIIPAQFVLGGGAMLLGLPPQTAIVFMMFGWFVMAGMLMVTTSLWLLPMTLGYMGGFLLAARHPDQVLNISSVANAILLANGVVYSHMVTKSETMLPAWTLKERNDGAKAEEGQEDS